MRYFDHAVPKLGAEEQRGAAGRGVVDVEQHEAKVARASEAERRCAVLRVGHGRRRVRRQKLEAGVEFARAEAGLMEALAALALAG